MKTISIHWKIADPPSLPVIWKEIVPPKITGAPRDLALGCAAGTNDFLNYAFANSFSRSCGWLSHHPAAKDAASLFKRGVALNEISKQDTVQTGNYNIDFFSAQAQIEKVVCETGSFVIVDNSVHIKWPDLINKIPKKYIVEIDEITKNLDTVADIMFASGTLKKWICIGGGVLTDTAAMAAALTSAQITFVPTTLLAMADACVGGKTGVNFAPFGKNQVGRFYFPCRVVIWDGWLQTLDPRHITGGACEGIKHTLLKGDKNLYQEIFNTLQDDKKSFAGILPQIIQIKADVVSQDATESGMRATLNLGHTLAHALESMSQTNNPQNPIAHGEAVGIGLVFALYLSHYECGLSKEFCKQFADKMHKYGCLLSQKSLETFLKSPLNSSTFDQLLEITKTDKKADQNSVYWVLLNSFGNPYFEKGDYKKTASSSSLANSWDSLLAALK